MASVPTTTQHSNDGVPLSWSVSCRGLDFLRVYGQFWHLSISLLDLPHVSLLSEQSTEQPGNGRFAFPRQHDKPSLCCLLYQHNDVGLETFFVESFSPSIWEKCSFKTGICPPVPRWLFCAQACTSRHCCLCITRPALLLIQITTFIVPNNGACPIAYTEAHDCH